MARYLFLIGLLSFLNVNAGSFLSKERLGKNSPTSFLKDCRDGFSCYAFRYFVILCRSNRYIEVHRRNEDVLESLIRFLKIMPGFKKEGILAGLEFLKYIPNETKKRSLIKELLELIEETELKKHPKENATIIWKKLFELYFKIDDMELRRLIYNQLIQVEGLLIGYEELLRAYYTVSLNYGRIILCDSIDETLIEEALKINSEIYEVVNLSVNRIRVSYILAILTCSKILEKVKYIRLSGIKNLSNENVLQIISRLPRDKIYLEVLDLCNLDLDDIIIQLMFISPSLFNLKELSLRSCKFHTSDLFKKLTHMYLYNLRSFEIGTTMDINCIRDKKRRSDAISNYVKSLILYFIQANIREIEIRINDIQIGANDCLGIVNEMSKREKRYLIEFRFSKENRIIVVYIKKRQERVSFSSNSLTVSSDCFQCDYSESE